MNGAVQIAGAGPAGLAAAITLARAGREVIVHEASREVGHRFGRDLQGLENWMVEQDPIAELEALGLSTQFHHLACTRFTSYDALGRAHVVQSGSPIFYLLERGPRPGTFDSALLEEARTLGVAVRFGSRVEELEAPAVLSAGPRAADAIAVGYHFEADMPDGAWAICDDALAPQGYAYLLVLRGRGTVKSCMFSGFKSERTYVERTVEAFRRLVGLRMRAPKLHGGIGNFRVPASARAGARPVAGEEAGFQDALWGFGMRFAIRSGVLAARAILEGADYDKLWRRNLGPLLRVSIVNRALYSMLGNRGYAWCLGRAASTDGRDLLRRYCRPSWLKRVLEPWARMRVRSRRRDSSCDHVGCECIWCRCGGVLVTE